MFQEVKRIPIERLSKIVSAYANTLSVLYPVRIPPMRRSIRILCAPFMRSLRYWTWLAVKSLTITYSHVLATSTPLGELRNQTTSPTTKMYCARVSRPLALPRLLSLLESSHTVCSMSAVNDQNVKSGSIASRTSLQSCSLLPYLSTTNCSSRMRLSTVCRRPSLCSTPSAIRAGL